MRTLAALLTLGVVACNGTSGAKQWPDDSGSDGSGIDAAVEAGGPSGDGAGSPDAASESGTDAAGADAAACSQDSGLLTITKDFEVYQASTAWWALNNTWGNAGLVNGKDYAQSITVEPSCFPASTQMQWSWPSAVNTSSVRAYPEVVYGNQEGNGYPSPNGVAPAPIAIQSLTKFVGTFDLTLAGDTQGYDVLWETQLTKSATGAQEYEIGIMLHAPQYIRDYCSGLAKQYTYSSAAFSAQICIVPDNGGGYPFIIVMPKAGDVLSGTIDVLSIYKYLESVQVITDDPYLVGYELGAETYYGTGGVTINQLTYTWY